MNNREVKDGALIIRSEDGRQQLTVREVPDNGVMNISVDGDITSETALCFADELMTAVTVSNVLVIDLSGVGFISSVGFKALLNTQKTVDSFKGKSLRLRGVSQQLLSSFEEIGFDGLFIIEQ